MKDKQRVYIKGNAERGNEIIKLLEDLGGQNTFPYNGRNENFIYFINPKGDIDHTLNSNTSMILPYIKEFYNEIKLPRWKPQYKEPYYRINWKGAVVETTWYNTQDEEVCYKFGNCFRTKKEAEAARDKIKNVLNNRIFKLETRLKNLERSILESDNNIKKLEKLTSDIKAQEIWEKFQKERKYFKKKSY